MNEVKPHLSYEGQIDKLHEKGCIIDDDSFCKDVLAFPKDWAKQLKK